MSAASLTYDSLLDDLSNYAERTDEPFMAQRARFVMMAENRIAAQVRGLGYVRYVNGTMTQANAQMNKPARWRETISMSITTSTGKKYLKERGYEYCRKYWPDSSVTAEPTFYANYDYEHFLVAATPDSAYEFELAYYERPEPLTDTNQTNWTTQYAPQLLLYACLLEAQPFLKMPERIAEFKGLYDEAAAMLASEAQRRASDFANIRKES